MPLILSSYACMFLCMYFSANGECLGPNSLINMESLKLNKNESGLLCDVVHASSQYAVSDSPYNGHAPEVSSEPMPDQGKELEIEVSEQECVQVCKCIYIYTYM